MVIEENRMPWQAKSEGEESFDHFAFCLFNVQRQRQKYD